MMKRLSYLLLAAVLASTIFIVAFCGGLIRPPRPVFHESYAAGGFGLIPTWHPNATVADRHGQRLWTDRPDNFLVIQATGTSERGRSHAMTSGTEASRFRLGSASDYEKDNLYVRIPRMRDTLVVILPDGRWKSFPLELGEAGQFYMQAGNEPSDDLFQAIEPFLAQTVRDQLREYLEGYSRP